MNKISKNLYYHYNNFLLNGHKTDYNFLLDENIRSEYVFLHDELEYRELKFYKRKFGKNKIQNIPDDWKEELASFLSNGGMSADRANEVMAEAFFSSDNYDAFQKLLIQKIHEEVDRGQLSLFYETNKSLENTILSLYKTLEKRQTHQTISQSHRKGSGRVYISGPAVGTLEGWMIEIIQGVVSTKKQSTRNDPVLKVVADFVVPGIGLEESKRNKSDNRTGNILLDSNFRIGMFTVNPRSKNGVPEYLAKIFADCATAIVTGIQNNNPKKIEQARAIYFKQLSYFIYPYLENRLLNYTKKGEIFYFSSGGHIILGSDFISGLIGLNKLYINGATGNSAAKIESSITVKLLDKIGIKVDPTKDKPGYEQLGFNFDERSKDILNYKLENKYKNGTFLTYAKFDLWYGKRY